MVNYNGLLYNEAAHTHTKCIDLVFARARGGNEGTESRIESRSVDNIYIHRRAYRGVMPSFFSLLFFLQLVRSGCVT